MTAPLTATSGIGRQVLSGTVVPARAPGRGRLTVALDESGRRSVVTRAFATSPLRLLLPKNHGRAAWIYTSSYGGGLVDGDAIAIDLHVKSGASAMLSTQSATKVYRSRGTRATLRTRVAANGFLAILPDPVVCFAASRYRQVQSFDMEPGSRLVLVDWISSGRHARGERWAFNEYVARLEARMDGKLVLYDALALRSEDGDLKERLGRFDVLAVLLILGASLRQHATDLVGRASAMPIARRADLFVAATPIGESGCLVRLAGTSFEQAASLVRDYLAFLPGMLGDDPWARKW